MMAKTAILLKNTTSSSLVLVIAKNGENARSYVDAVKSTIDQLLLTNAPTPVNLQKALYKLPIKELKKPEAVLALNVLLTAYELYYGDYVKGRIGGNETASQLLTAIRDGANDALELTATP